MLWITMASAFDVSSGISGYLPFGCVAFYGIGAFTTAILVKKLAFGIVSLALAGTCRLVITNMLEEITGSSFGLQLRSRVQPVQSYHVMKAVMVVVVATIIWLSRSRLGSRKVQHASPAAPSISSSMAPATRSLRGSDQSDASARGGS